MKSETLHDLGVRLAAGDREAAFRLAQRQRALRGVAVMKARGFPNLVKARQQQLARLTPVEPGDALIAAISKILNT